MLPGFTFDLYLIAKALIAAAVRGLDVTSVLDFSHALGGSTTWMVDRLSEMRTGGVKVLLSSGVSGDSGIQHSKTVLCDEYVIIGSCNWTYASRANQEIDVLLALNEVGLAAYDEHLKYIKEHSLAFNDEMEREGRESRKERAAAKERDQESARLPRR